MNKAFFSSIQDRLTGFSDRVPGEGDVRAEVTLVTGRTVVSTGIVEADDGWVQIDGHDVHDEDVALSLIVPYHQISSVILTRTRAKSRAGIRPAGF